MKHKILLSLLALLPLSMQAQQTAVSFHSTDGDYWKMKTATVVPNVGRAQVVIRTDQAQQTFRGWGTCFNELDYDAWSLLSEQDRALFLKRVFNPNGDLRLTVGRIPVGASDYACDWYSCDETEGNVEDFEMKHFSIQRDLTKVIPSIKAAQQQNPDMTFWASPWSPPQWMKTNKHYAQRVTSTNGCPFGVPPFDNDQFVDDERYYKAYCLYFDKFIQAYREQGIPITALAYQNEAYSNTPYPGCSWKAATTGKFLANYLGPYMAEHQPDLTLIIGTMNTNRWDVFETILATPNIGKYCRQIGFQWEGRDQIANIRRTYPDYELVQTENECGSGTFDWNAAAHTFELCNHYLTNGVTTYTYWNAILQDRGESRWGWIQNALVQVNSSTNKAKYCAEYYAYKHYTHLIPAGSRILTCDPSNLLTSALTPDGNVVVVIGNDKASEKTLTLDIDGQCLVCTLAPKSFASYVVGTQANVAKMLRTEAQGLVDVEGDFLTAAQTTALNSALSTGTYNALLKAVSDVEAATGHSEVLNPSFTDGANYWTVANVAASGDFRAAMVLDKTCYNNWSNNFTSLDIHQDLSGLQPGLYTVSAKSVCGEGNITDQHVYAETDTHLVPSPVKADDVWNAANWETQTTPAIYVGEDGRLRVGYASTSGGGTKGWFCVTDFVVTRIGDLTADFDLSLYRKSDPMQSAREAYQSVADEARLLAVNETYDEASRSELSALLSSQSTLLDAITEPALVDNLRRELEEQMAVVRSNPKATTYTPQPVGEGTYFLYDATAGQFLNYNPSSTNFPQLADYPTRIALASNGEGSYAMQYADVNYLKIGTWNGLFLFGDATEASNTHWTFAPVEGKSNTYVISTNQYAETAVSGTYYLSGSNASATASEAHEYVLVDMAEYVERTGKATHVLVSPTIVAQTTKGWLRDNNQAGGYAENPSAIQSAAHSGYGISHWRGSAISNSRLIYQTIEGLPAGTYKLEAYAAASVWNNNSGNDNRPGVVLFATDGDNTTTVPVASPTYSRYALQFTLAEGQTLTLGLQAEAGNQNNWVFLSDVALSYLGKNLLLNEDEAFVPTSTEANVLLRRTIYEGWNTVVLPFALAADEVASLLGPGSLYKYNGNTEGTLEFQSAEDVQPHVPYIFRADAARRVDDLVMGRTIQPADNDLTATGTDYDLVGTYTPYAQGAEANPIVVGSDYVLAGDNAFHLTATKNALKAFRAYVRGRQSSGVKSALAISLDGVETSLSDVLSGEPNFSQTMYDLSGRRIAKPRKGLYIQGGKLKMDNGPLGP